MHIPGNMLAGHVVPVTNGLGAVAVAGAAYFAVKSKNKPAVSCFAAVAALIFALQMMNFPVQDGTSGHLIGAFAAVVLLGAPFGILAMALVLAVQSVVFADGGVSALGANILNMAVVGGLLGAGVRAWVGKKSEQAAAGEGSLLFAVRDYAAYGAGAWVSVLAAAALCSLQLAFSGVADFGVVFSAMMSVHFLIGAGEAVISVAVIALLARFFIVEKGNELRDSFSNERVGVGLTLAVAAFVGFFLSPFASSFPDGLEFVAEKLGFETLAAPNFVTPFADYTFPQIVPVGEILSTGLAGLTGVLITFAVVWLCGTLIKRSAVVLR